MKSKARSVFAAVAICFLVSGIAGLVYQVVWSRYLALFLGHTSYAVIAVLAAFMGGLALGNSFFGARADRSAKPLAMYAWLEIGIGIYALIFPQYYSYCHDAFVSVARSLRPGSTGLLGLKFLFSFITILVPTVLMGATFPVMAKFVTRSLAELRQRVAALYAINSAGAAAGCLIADFWSIPNNGLEATIYAAGALNLIVGLVAYIMSVRLEGGGLPSEPAPTPSKLPSEQYSPSELRLALVAIGLSGFVAMLYEVAWTRLLALALGSSTHAFSLMLTTFITGIAVGAAIVYLWKGLRRALVAFGWAEIGLAASLLVSMFFYQYLSFWFMNLASLLARREEAYPLYGLAQAAICFSVMFVPTVFMGMTLPLISRVATVELARTGRSVGRVFAVNTLGTVAGTIVTGLLLMPWLGLARTFATGVGLSATIGLAALLWNRSSRRILIVVPVLAGGVMIWVVGAKLDPIWQRAFSMGLWRMPNPPQTLAAFHAMAENIPMLYHKDGAGSTVDVYSWTEGEKENLTLKVNGKADAGTGIDMITQLLLGHLPMLLHPDSKDVLVIGLGSGVTCGAIAQHPSLERVDVVEISPEVVQASRLFSNFNHQVLDNPKLSLAIEDAKSFLKTTDRQYDAIISEPSNPWMAGVAGVFTQEYYADCVRRLKPGGVIVQWIHVYETTDEAVSLVLRTFLTAFPHLSIWQPAMGDLMLVGSLQPLTVDLEAVRERFQVPAVKADLARAGLNTLPVILAREMISQQNGKFIIPEIGPIHSDFYPALEYVAQRAFFLGGSAQGWYQYHELFTPRATTWFADYLRRHSLTDDDFNAFSEDYAKHRLPDTPILRSLLYRWQGDSSLPAFPVGLWAHAAEQVPPAQIRVMQVARFADAMMAEAASNPEPLRRYAIDLMGSYRLRRSIFYLPTTEHLEKVLQRLMECDPTFQRLGKLYLAETAWDKGDDARCLELGQQAFVSPATGEGPASFAPDPQAPLAVLYRMIESFWRAGKIGDAWSLCEQARTNGYLEGAGSVFPLLEAAYRKVASHLAAQDAQPGLGEAGGPIGL